ncbi:MAG: zinc finger protein [Actinomycetota bacterium]
MDELVRCPNCGASNPRDAAWCGQCQTPFSAPGPAIEAQPAPQPEPVTRVEHASRPEPVDPPVTGETARPPTVAQARVEAAPATREHGPFAMGQEGVTWTCSACGSNNSLELPVCSVCGASFKATVEPESQAPERDANKTALVSLVYPGAGFAYLGRWPEAIGRGVVGTFALAVALIAAIIGHGGTAAAITVTYGFAAFGLWTVSSHDAFRAAQGQDAMVILKPRTLLYVLLGLLVLFLVLLMGSVISHSSH